MMMAAHNSSRWLRVALPILMTVSLAENVSAEPTDLANRYLKSRPEIYGAGMLAAIGIAQANRSVITPESTESAALIAAKMASPAKDWNATHPRWKKVVEQVKADLPSLLKAGLEDSRMKDDPNINEQWREVFAHTLTHELSEEDMQSLIDFYESPVGKRFGEANRRVYDLARKQKAQIMLSLVKGEPYDLSGLSELFSRPLEECDLCASFVDRETLGEATGFPLINFNYKELGEVWRQALTDKDSQIVRTFRRSDVADRERKAMKKGSFAIRGTASFKEFLRARQEFSEQVEEPYMKKWRALVKDDNTTVSDSVPTAATKD